jgi:hypothetical protein
MGMLTYHQALSNHVGSVATPQWIMKHNGALPEENKFRNQLDLALLKEYYLGVYDTLPCQHWHHFILTKKELFNKPLTFKKDGSSMWKLHIVPAAKDSSMGSTFL